jgi:hypothetical protein
MITANDGGRRRQFVALAALAAAAVSFAGLATASPTVLAGEVQKSVYRDDPAVLAQLEALRPGQSLVLGPVRALGEGVEAYPQWYRNGPGQRDYCNKMPYAPDRGTALYAGGNHAVPHRLNDVWEYHLGSNTWHLLYGPDGGNPGQWKAAYFLTARTLVKDPGRELTESEQAQVDGYRRWWLLLAFPPGGRGKQLALAAYSLEANRWELVEPDGPAVPATRFGSYMGYFDERHGVFVVQGRNTDRMWVYRHRRAA